MIFRAKQKNNFTIVPNKTINDSGLSLRSKGLLLYLLSKPDNWNVSLEQLASVCSEGRGALRSSISELLEAGYLERERTRDNKGQMSGYNYNVYDRARSTVVRFSDDGKPLDGKPSTGNRTLISTVDNKNIETSITNVIEPPAPKQYGDPTINQVIDEWKRVTGLGIHTRVQMNRNAVKRMVNQHKLENVIGAISVVAEMNRKQYTTSIPDLETMAQKWNAIRIYYEKNYGSGSGMTEINF